MSPNNELMDSSLRKFQSYYSAIIYTEAQLELNNWISGKYQSRYPPLGFTGLWGTATNKTQLPEAPNLCLSQFTFLNSWDHVTATGEVSTSDPVNHSR